MLQNTVEKLIEQKLKEGENLKVPRPVSRMLFSDKKYL